MTPHHMSQQEAGNISARSFRFARYGFNLLLIYWILQLFLEPNGITAENIVISLFLAASVTSLLVQVYIGNRRGQTYSQFDFVSRIIFYSLLLVCAVTWLRGLTANPGQLLTLLFNPEVGGTVWLLPLFALIGTQKGVIQALMPMFYRHAGYGLGFSLAALILFQAGQVELARSTTKSAHLLLYAAYFVLLAGLGTWRSRRFFFAALVAVSLCHFLLVNRLHFIVGSSVLLICLVIRNTREKSRIWMRTGFALFLSVGAGFMALQAVSPVPSESWQTDTRTFLFLELRRDFSQKEFVFGRGALGTYYSEYFYKLKEQGVEGGDAAVRQVSEVGYLHVILKAGFLGVVAIVLFRMRVLFLASRLADYRTTFGAIVFFSFGLLGMLISYQLSFDSVHIFSYIVAGWVISEARRNRKCVRQ